MTCTVTCTCDRDGHTRDLICAMFVPRDSTRCMLEREESRVSQYQHVNFRPWVGRNHQSSRWGLRVLVLGESHYKWEGKDPGRDETTRIVREHWMAGERRRFSTNTVAAFLGHRSVLTDERISEFWDSVLFYNFVQSALPGARTRPTEDQWCKAQKAFREVLKRHEPQVVVALGYQLWKQMPGGELEEGPQWKVAGQAARDTCFYSAGPGRALAGCIKHPSSGFSSRAWYPWLRELLKLASKVAGKRQ